MKLRPVEFIFASFNVVFFLVVWRRIINFILLYYFLFAVLLTVRLSIIFETDQLNAQILVLE